MTATPGDAVPAAILAGGRATRLGALAADRPKSLVEVAGAPFIVHQLRLLRAGGVARVVVCIGHLGDQIQATLGDGARFGLEIAYSADGPQPLGTAGALRQALPLLGGTFFVLYGDSYLDCDYPAILRAFRASGQPALMAVLHNAGRWDTSNVAFAGGAIRAYDKRRPAPAMQHVDYGLGVLARAAFAGVPAATFYDLADLYHDLAAGGRLAAYQVPDRFYEIGSPAGLAATRRHLEGP